MANEDMHWSYVDDNIAADYLVTSNTLPTPIDTQLTRPEDVIAEQAKIDAVEASISLAAAREPHTNDEDREDDNKKVLIASIVGAVVLTLMVISALHKWTT